MEERDYDTTFSCDRIVSGFGSLWCADFRWPLLVRVDPQTLTGEIFAELPADVSLNEDSPLFRGPYAIAAGLGAVWAIPRMTSYVLRVDPQTAAIRSWDLPFPASDFAVGPDAVFFIDGAARGQVGRLDPMAGITTASIGSGLRLIAADVSYVWTVDDAAADVLALDATTLSVVHSFHHLGSPDSLVARGTVAWYLAAHEVELPPENGRQSRAAVLSSAGPSTDLLRFDAADGSTDLLAAVPTWLPEAALGSDGLWLTADSVAEIESDDNPESRLIHLDIDGAEISTVSCVGQLQAVAVDEDIVWTSGFRRSLQADVLTARRHDMTLLGETTLPEIDLSPWYLPDPEDEPIPPMPERAERLRAWLDESLRTPSQVHGRFGDTWEEPPISEEFHLEQVEVRSIDGTTTIAILFRWNGEDEVFGMVIPLNESDATTDDYIGVYVQENLIAGGLGVQNAHRERADDVTWLSWAQWE